MRSHTGPVHQTLACNLKKERKKWETCVLLIPLSAFPPRIITEMVCSKKKKIIPSTLYAIVSLFFSILISDKIKDAKIIFVVGEYALMHFCRTKRVKNVVHQHSIFVFQVGPALERAPSVRGW